MRWFAGAYRDAVSSLTELLRRCEFPDPGSSVDVAISGGPDSVGLALLAHEYGLRIHLHHVNHHLRESSDVDAHLVLDLGERLGLEVTVHDVHIPEGGNLEARARAARRSVLPPGALTGHTMDDLAETMLLNLLWGAGIDGLSPMVNDRTKPLLHVRRMELRNFVEACGQPFIDDPTNLDESFRRNAIRHRLLPHLHDIGERDMVPVLARQAHVVADDAAWLAELTAEDTARSLADVDCRELQQWGVARLRRWVRAQLTTTDGADGTHPPTLDEVTRVIAVIRGECVATEISGGRRVARKDQHLSLS